MKICGHQLGSFETMVMFKGLKSVNGELGDDVRATYIYHYPAPVNSVYDQRGRYVFGRAEKTSGEQKHITTHATP
jgi:hypothetical protein